MCGSILRCDSPPPSLTKTSPNGERAPFLVSESPGPESICTCESTERCPVCVQMRAGFFFPPMSDVTLAAMVFTPLLLGHSL